jgi:hypothetical protein
MQKIDDYVFQWNPDRMTIPVREKLVAEVNTYGGSEVFQWPPLYRGTRITLEWNYMPALQWKRLRSKYLKTDRTYIYDPDAGGQTYNVTITRMSGKYHDVVHSEGDYRSDVVVQLSIRSLEDADTTTSTTTTTTTTS